jgi:hypothetical protein
VAQVGFAGAHRDSVRSHQVPERGPRTTELPPTGPGTPARRHEGTKARRHETMVATAMRRFQPPYGVSACSTRPSEGRVLNGTLNGRQKKSAGRPTLEIFARPSLLWPKPGPHLHPVDADVHRRQRGPGREAGPETLDDSDQLTHVRRPRPTVEAVVGGLSRRRAQSTAGAIDGGRDRRRQTEGRYGRQPCRGGIRIRCRAGAGEVHRAVGHERRSVRIGYRARRSD